jgi:hypothetical protein
MVHNVQNCDSHTNIPSPQTYISYLQPNVSEPGQEGGDPLMLKSGSPHTVHEVYHSSECYLLLVSLACGLNKNVSHNVDLLHLNVPRVTAFHHYGLPLALCSHLSNYTHRALFNYTCLIKLAITAIEVPYG